MPYDTFQYKFDEFSLLPNEKLLLRGTNCIPISRRAFEVLHLLIMKEGRIVNKQEFLDKVWVNTYVEEGNLAVAINSLRKILNTDKSKVYIETFPKRGYRFTAQVEKIAIEHFSEKDAKQPDVLSNAILPSAMELPTVVQSQSALTKSRPFFLSSWRQKRWLLLALIIGFVFYVLSTINLAEPAKIDASVQKGANSFKVKVAVLPFVDLKPSPETRILSLSFTDTLIYELSQNADISIVSSIPIDKYFQKIPNPYEIKNEVVTDFVITGTFVKNGNMMEVSSQLIEVKTGEIILETKENLNNESQSRLKKEFTSKIVSQIKLYSNQFSPSLKKK